MASPEIWFLTATELASCIRAKDLSAKEVMEAHLAQIERVNPKVNAIVTLLPEKALEQASAADENLVRGKYAGPLHGLPIAHKDLIPTRGIRTTSGSLAFRDFVPQVDGLIVERLKQAGAITIGKTNTPEFGAGSQTFNEVFGEGAAAGQQWPLPAECCRSQMEAIWAVHCATQLASAMWWDFDLPPEECLYGLTF